MVYLQTTYELCFGKAYLEYFESCDFSRENTNIDVSVFMFDLRMINMSSESQGLGASEKKKKKNYIILQGGELTCFHFFKSSC